MFKTATIKAALLALGAMLLGWSNTALAQAATCGIRGSASAQPAVYDPFNPTGLATTRVTLTLTRIDPTTTAGAKTAIVSFFLRSNSAAADGTSIVPVSVVGAVNNVYLPGQSIFYNFAAAAPFMGPSTSSTNPIGSNRYLKVEFTGNNEQSNPVTVQFDVTVPASLNLTASTVLPFDAIYRCTTTGGGSPTDQAGSLAGAVSFPVTVLSALQASFAGTALNFGEIGTVTNVMAPTTTTGTGNYIRVQSSGAYVVTLSSQNAFRLKHPTGSLAVPLERIAYSLKFLGLTRNNVSNPTTGAISYNVQCARAGVGSAFEDRLYLLATLDEGGQGKTPSLGGNYSDILTVTITPQSIATTYPDDCNAFTVP